MKTESKIKTTEDFFEFLQKETTEKGFWKKMYRGVSNSSYKLIPSIGRFKTYDKKNLNTGDEIEILNDFKKMAYPYIKDYNFNTLELLSFGRHHGLPTRLLDWTQNPLVAVYFAVEKPFIDNEKKENEETKNDYSCIYIYKAEKPIELSEPFDPFTIAQVKYYLPKYSDNRIIAQGGLFTVHNDPYTHWEPENLQTVLIHKDIRGDIKRILNKMWVNASVLYPDLDGIAKHVEWLHSDLH